jgi:hypothetical protein
VFARPSGSIAIAATDYFKPLSISLSSAILLRRIALNSTISAIHAGETSGRKFRADRNFPSIENLLKLKKSPD